MEDAPQLRKGIAMEFGTGTEFGEFDLDVSIVATGMPATVFGSEDCTGDGCTGTEDSAGVTC